MSELQRITPERSSADQQAPVVFIDINKDGRIVKTIMTRKDGEASRATAGAQNIQAIDDARGSTYAASVEKSSLSASETRTPALTDEGMGYEKTQSARPLPEQRHRGSVAKKMMAKLAVGAMLLPLYPIGDAIGTFLQSGNVLSAATTIEDVTQLPDQSVEFYQWIVATIQGAKSITDTINSIQGNK